MGCPWELSDGRRILDSALRPERIQAARDAQSGLCSYVSFIDLAIVAYRPNGTRGPIMLKAQLMAEFTFAPDQAPDVGIGRFQRIVDRRRLDAELLGVDQGVERPLDQIEPLVVALSYHRPERLFRDDFGQDDIAVGRRELETLRVELRNVARKHVAFAIVIRLAALLRGAERQNVQRHVVGAEIVP